MPLQDTNSFPLDICSEMRLLNLTLVLFFIFWGTSTLFSIMATPICVPTRSTELLLVSLSVFFSSYLVGNGQSNRCEVISDVILICISLMISDFSATFHIFVTICMSSLEKSIFMSFAHLKNQAVCFLLLLSCMSSFYILDISLIRYMVCKYFLPLHRLPFHFVDGFLCWADAL